MSKKRVYSEVEPFEGWKQCDFVARDTAVYVYSEVEPFEGWKLFCAYGKIVKLTSL